MPPGSPAEPEPEEWTPPPLVTRWRQGDVADPRRYLLFTQRTLRRWDAHVRNRVFRSDLPDRLAPVFGRQVISVLGDSHARVFAEVGHRRALPRTWIDVTVASGATSIGLGNPDSKSDASRRFRSALKAPVPVTRRTLVWLGEIDCGSLIWVLAENRSTPISVQLERSLQSYQAFLTALVREGRPVALVSVVPPTIADYTQWDGLEGARNQVTATLEERTELTRTYNLRMREWADREGCGYLDLDPWLLDPSTGLLAEQYRNRVGWDHHLDSAGLSAVLAARLPALDWPADAGDESSSP